MPSAVDQLRCYLATNPTAVGLVLVLWHHPDLKIAQQVRESWRDDPEALLSFLRKQADPHERITAYVLRLQPVTALELSP